MTARIAVVACALAAALALVAPTAAHACGFFPLAPPTAAFTASPEAPQAGDPVQLDGTSSLGGSSTMGILMLIDPANPGLGFSCLPGGAPVLHPVTAYTWSFGDGTPDVTGAAGTVAHAFATAGDYTVKLVVSSVAGVSAPATRTITVKAKPAPVTTEPPPTTTTTTTPQPTPPLAAPAQPAAPATPATTPAKTDREYCAALTKRRLGKRRRSPFGRCVAAMAKLRKNTALTPRKACAGQPKRKVRGMKGTPFGACVRAGAALRSDLNG